MTNYYNKYLSDFSSMSDRSLIKQITRELESECFGEYYESHNDDSLKYLKFAFHKQSESFYNYDDAM